jgi:hypothetical protein
MRTTLILAAVLFMALAVYFTFIFNPNGGTLEPGDTAFAVEDSGAVQRIVMTQYVQGQPKREVRLTRLPDGDWQLNGQYPAMMPRVRNLLKVMSRLQVREVLNDAAQANARRFFAAMRTQVDAYGPGGQLLRSYNLGSETPGARGTLMRMQDSETAYVVELPGLQGYVKAAYSLDPSFWRANRLFDADLSRLLRFSLLYREPERSFTLKRVNDSTFALAGPGPAADAQRLDRYLRQFQGMVYGETFAEAQYPGRREKLEQLDPDLRLIATYRDGSERSLVLFDREDNPNNFFGWVEGENELLTVQHFVIDPFLRDRRFLLREEREAPELERQLD